MKISILTLFPKMFVGPFELSIIKRAQDKKLVQIEIVDIRNFGQGRHKTVDDKPYGGGVGMIIKVDVLENAIEKTKKLFEQSYKSKSKIKQMVILLSPQGNKFDQKKAKGFSKLDHLILVCGHYEGIDARIGKFVDEEISIGDFILTGGEIPSMIITDSVVRLLKGVIRKGATLSESFSPYLEYPQYTLPRTYKNLSVPEILLSGDHKKIEEWRVEKALEITSRKRPDLINKAKKKKI
jgi:tRNA (guanine37-N1)-methyltransferase